MPESAEQISEVLNYCNKGKIAVCPQGGNTGLVMGSHPIFDEVVISLKRMNKIHNFDTSYGILKC